MNQSKILLGTILLFTALICSSQTQVENPVLRIAKETSLYTNNVNWDEITKGYNNILEQGGSKKEAYTYLLNELGDKHGGFRNRNTFQFIAYYTGEDDEDRTFDSDFYSSVINDIDLRFSCKKIGNNIGYLQVVGVGPQHPMEYTTRIIQNSIDSLRKLGSDRWILDLRYNGGGNMNPMISGLSALLKDGNIGGSIDHNNNHLQEFNISNNQFIDTGNIPVNIENPVQVNLTDKVAVLLSKYTASSGEIVAVVFKGRDNTRFFGERTMGMTTVTGWDIIDDETIMLISKAYYRDRNGRVYKNGVDVDERITFTEFCDPENDLILKKSIEWLKR